MLSAIKLNLSSILNNLARSQTKMIFMNITFVFEFQE